MSKKRAHEYGTKADARDIENFSFNYAWSETAKQDPIIASDVLLNQNGGFAYALLWHQGQVH